MLDEVDGDDSDGEGTKSIDVSSVGLFLESVSPVLEGHFFANSQIRIQTREKFWIWIQHITLVMTMLYFN